MVDRMTPHPAPAENGEEFPTEQPNADGWSDWIHPLPGYRMACCDCCMVHELETRIDAAGNVNIRLRRNDAATLRLRDKERVEVRTSHSTPAERT